MGLRPLAAMSLLAVLACQTAAPSSGGSAAGRGGAELAAVIDAVKQAIVAAQTREVSGFPPLKSIAVKLQTTVSRSASGGVKYLVISLSGGVSAQTASSLELDLKPPEAPHAIVPKETLEDALANAIHLAKVGVAEAAKGDPPLAMKSISIDLKFAVDAQGSAAVGVKLVPIGLEATAKITQERVHSVTLTFAP